jgi:hypothetical protein
MVMGEKEEEMGRRRGRRRKKKGGGGRGVAKGGEEGGEMDEYGKTKKEINDKSFMNDCDTMKGCI